MTTSLDGKVTGNFLEQENSQAGIDEYYRINREFMADAFACGRITMESSFTGGWYPDLTDYPEVKHDLDLKMDFLPDDLKGFYAVAFDPKGVLGWQSNIIVDDDPGYGGAQIIEVLTEQVDLRYLGYLEAMEIPYIFAGETEIDVEVALCKLKNLIGINTLLLEGGSIINGYFQRSGMIDELSLVMLPVCGDKDDKQLFCDSVMENYRLYDVQKLDGEALWLRYNKE